MDGNKKIAIQKKTKVYVMAPSNTFTGGPELLHQLADDIKKIYKVNIKMFYLPLTDSNPIHKNFTKYKIDYSSLIEDDKKNILIIPEHYIFLKHSLKYKNIKKILWWLSIDNYFGYKFRNDYNKFFRSLIKIPFNLVKFFNKITNYHLGNLTYHSYLKFIYKYSNLNNFKELKQVDWHFSQSKYGINFLKKYFKNLKYLSDYQREEITKSSRLKNFNKKNLICFSSKSSDFIKSIESFHKQNMIKLSGLNDKQIINIYKKTKIYIDFGYHPGKDRMPREAVLFNNCIITNKKGSAKNNIDIPISKKYKFDETKSNLVQINNLILRIFKQHKKELKNFKNYKKIVLNERNKFLKDLKKIFIKN